MSPAEVVGSAYDVAAPEEWKPYVSFGKLWVIGSPFYGTRIREFGLSPVVRFRWSLKNLTPHLIWVELNYASSAAPATDGSLPLKTGYDVCYALAQHEERPIDDIAVVASAKVPVTLRVRAESLRVPEDARRLPAAQTIVATGALSPCGLPREEGQAVEFSQGRLLATRVRLAHLKEEGNAVVADVRNIVGTGLLVGMYVAIAGPGEADKTPSAAVALGGGTFSEAVVVAAPHRDTALTVPYSVPDSSRKPLLAFTLFEAPESYVPDADPDSMSGVQVQLRRDIRPVSCGWYDLRQAADRRLCVLPVFVPAEERAKLTAEAKSQHFVFHYRLGSYAEKHLEAAIREREKAYGKLSRALTMDLPGPVRIDLYPDMEAKGLGSGTAWTPGNTVSSSHIAEVYSESTRLDPNHELAHVFSYRFGGCGGDRGERGAGLVEGFAVCFQKDTNAAQFRAAARAKLLRGELLPISELLLARGPADEVVAVIGFLLKKDVDKFKKLYVRVTQKPTAEEAQAAAGELYGEPVQQLDAEWRRYLEGQD